MPSMERAQTPVQARIQKLLKEAEESDLTPIVKSLPEVQQFLNQYTDADIRATYWDEAVTNTSIEAIRADCGSQMQAKDYWKVVVLKDNVTIVIWLDADDNKPVCIIKPKTGNVQPQTDAEEEEVAPGTDEEVEVGEEESPPKAGMEVEISDAFCLNHDTAVLLIHNTGDVVVDASKDMSFIGLTAGGTWRYADGSTFKGILQPGETVKFSTACIDTSCSYKVAAGEKIAEIAVDCSNDKCRTGERQCSDNYLQECSSDGNGWETLLHCDYGCDSAALKCISPTKLSGIETEKDNYHAGEAVAVKYNNHFPYNVIVNKILIGTVADEPGESPRIVYTASMSSTVCPDCISTLLMWNQKDTGGFQIEPNTYVITLEYTIETGAKYDTFHEFNITAATAENPPRGSENVSVLTDKATYSPGETVEFYFQNNEDVRAIVDSVVTQSTTKMNSYGLPYGFGIGFGSLGGTSVQPGETQRIWSWDQTSLQEQVPGDTYNVTVEYLFPEEGGNQWRRTSDTFTID